MYRMVLRDKLLRAESSMLELQGALLAVAYEHRQTVMPAHTHTQQAQPTTLAHYLVAVHDSLTSARSGDILGNRQVLVVWAVKSRTNSLSQLVGTQQPVRLHYPTLAVNPPRLHGVEPQTLFRQKAAYDPHSSFATALFDLAVMRGYPLSDLFGDVPRSVVPDQEPHLLTRLGESLGASLKETGGYGAHRTAIHKAQPHPLELRQVEPVAGDGFGVRIVLFERLLHKTQGITRLCPTIEGGSLKPTPPSLVFETHHPALRVFLRQADQPVAPSFFLAYSGSGLVIHRLARSQRTPKRSKVARMVSPLTRSFVSPSSKLTSAAISKVHKLLCLPNFLGFWCSNSRKASARSGLKAR